MPIKWVVSQRGREYAEGEKADTHRAVLGVLEEIEPFTSQMAVDRIMGTLRMSKEEAVTVIQECRDHALIEQVK